MNKQRRCSQCCYSFNMDRSALSLAVRECVSRLSLDSESTMNVIINKNVEDSQIYQKKFRSKSTDPVMLTAFSVLRKLFRSLKSEICRADDESDEEFSSVLHFLRTNPEERLSDITRRYAAENDLKSGRKHLKSVKRNSWREIDVLPPSDKSRIDRGPIPFNVPPLDPVQVEQCYDAVTPRSTGKRTANHNSSMSNRASLRIISDEVINSSEESSSESVSTDEAVSKLQALSAEVKNDVINSARAIQSVLSPIIQRSSRHKIHDENCRFVDKNCGTTSRDFFNYPLNANSNLHMRKDVFEDASLQNLKQDVNFKQIEKVSKEVQTGFDGTKVSICTQTDGLKALRSEEESLSSMMNSLKIAESSSATINSSSTFPSELSAGQIPLRKAVLLLESAQHRLIPVNVDGSVEPSVSVNIQWDEEPLNFSTPKRTHQSGSLRQSNLSAEKYFHHPGEIISYGNSSKILTDDCFDNYGIPLSKISRTNAYSSQKLKNGINGIAPSPRTPRVHDIVAPAFGRVFEQEENVSAAAPLVAREVSLLTSFDSSNTATKHADFDQYRRLIASSMTSTMSGDGTAAFEKKDAITSCETEVEEEIIEIVKNRSFSSTRSFHSKHLTKSTNSSSSSKILTNYSRHDVEDEEESTLNQISPLPTTG